MKLGAHVPLYVHPNGEVLGEVLATRILDEIQSAREAARRYVLGCPGGRSLKSTFDALGRLAGTKRADLSHVVLAMMDEYVVAAGAGYVRCLPAAHYSCVGFAEREIRAVLNAGLDASGRVPETAIWVADPADPLSYEHRLAKAGGIDLFLLASGATDGHVAFNPPGTPEDSRTRIVTIAEETRRDNMGTFPAFRSIDEVPTHGVSVGLGTIVLHSRSAALVIHGAHKAAAVRRLAMCQGFTPAWPASIIDRCAAPSIHLDDAAHAGTSERETAS